MPDPGYIRACYEENLRFIATEFFRARMVGAENLPLAEVGKRPIILVANHSGMGLSWDNIILDFLVYDRLLQASGDADWAIANKVVRLVDPLLISRQTVQPFGIADWFAKTGCVAASSANFEAAMRENRIVLVSPEGVAGIAKGPWRKYRLQPFSSSFLRMAHAFGALVVPVSVVNAEYLNPWNICLGWVNAVGRRLGFPFSPLGFAAFQALLPATYLTPRPARLTYVVHPAETFDAPSDPKAEAEAFRRRQQVRLDEAVCQYHAPYDLRSLFDGFRTSKRRKLYSPFFWHEMFLKTASKPAWMGLLYKIPLGYGLIALANRWVR